MVNDGGMMVYAPAAYGLFTGSSNYVTRGFRGLEYTHYILRGAYTTQTALKPFVPIRRIGQWSLLKGHHPVDKSGVQQVQPNALGCT